MRRFTWTVFGAFVALCAGLVPPARADLFPTTDVNPLPAIFECDLTAMEHDVTIAGSTVHAMVYRDEAVGAAPPSAGIPIQVIRVKVGDLVICRFKNELTAESASIHWHGIELDNDSDGTAVTQDAVLPGQSYTYMFQTFRPGVYWFHSHMMPGNTLFAGLYGVMIIENDIEASLKGTVLPTDDATFTLALSDIDFDATGKVGKTLDGVTRTLNELIEFCHQEQLGEYAGVDFPCPKAALPGKTVLVNGQTPDAAAQTPKFIVSSGGRIRLRLLNESVSRHFRLRLLGSGDNKLYRIGGQGGLLDNVIVEGGMKGTLATGYDLGEVTIGSGVRADAIIVPSGSEGSVIQLVGNPLTSPPFNLSSGFPADYPIAYFQISGTSSDSPIAEGAPILAGTVEDVEDIKTVATVAPLISPAPFGGSSDETITLTDGQPPGYASKTPSVDGYVAMLDSNVGNGDFLLLPHPPNARYAHIGDVLELSVKNVTKPVHPYHLHGFSMQPVRFVDNATGSTAYQFDYDEFLDTIDVYPGFTFVFRVRLDDRPRFCDAAPSYPPGPVLADCASAACGGAAGRWLYHCHIVQHGALGMISELVVLNTPPKITCPDSFSLGTDPGECAAVVTFEVTATSACGPVTLESVPPSGSVFAAGTTTVTSTATDPAGQTSQCSFDVTVFDDEPPQLTTSLATAVLWSPNHELINVGLAATATDNCPDPVTFSVKVYGDEEDELSTGDGTHSPDAKDIAVGTLRLRAERKQKADGRVYLIVTTATDGEGNTTIACTSVVVPKDQTKKGFASVKVQADAAEAFYLANGSPPPGFVEIGDGPLIGSKQ